MSSEFEMPREIPRCMAELKIMYRKNPEKELLCEIISGAYIFMKEGGGGYDDYDNEGIWIHHLILFLDEKIFKKVADLKHRGQICSIIENDIGASTNYIRGECVRVIIKLAHDTDKDYKNSIKLSDQPAIDREDDSDIWEPGFIRLFISHLSAYKKEMTLLAEVLKDYGVSCFVAHKDIEPGKEWQKTIERALRTADAMAAAITDGFSKSYWTNQELGFGVCGRIPIILLKLQNEDPMGFVSHIQAIVGKLDSPENITKIADEIDKILALKLGPEFMEDSLVNALIKSPNWGETKKRFRRLQSLERIKEYNVEKIINAFAVNDQLHKCWHLKKSLPGFLEAKTGKSYEIKENAICEIIEEKIEEESYDEVPF